MHEDALFPAHVLRNSDMFMTDHLQELISDVIIIEELHVVFLGCYGTPRISRNDINPYVYLNNAINPFSKQPL